MYDEDGCLIDPIEKDPKYRNIFRKIDAEVDEALKDDPSKGKLGYCHIFWDTKQEMLKEKYGISWKTPTEMNPEILFD